MRIMTKKQIEKLSDEVFLEGIKNGQHLLKWMCAERFESSKTPEEFCEWIWQEFLKGFEKNG